MIQIAETTPSTEKQWNLANALVRRIEANWNVKMLLLMKTPISWQPYLAMWIHEVPTIGFISHFDTSPDFTGANVKPQIIENYDGNDIVLNEEKILFYHLSDFDDLLLYKGQTLITTDGTTLIRGR